MGMDILETLTREFLDETADRLVRVDNALVDLEAGRREAQSVLLEVHRELHNLKGMGGSFGFPAISSITHLFESYVKQASEAQSLDHASLHAFVDTLSGIVSKGVDPGESGAAALIEGLPVYRPNGKQEASGSPLTILVLNRSRIVARAVANVLSELGCGTIISTDPFEALSLAARSVPDLVLVSPTLEGIGGVDFVRALHAMSITRDLPVAMVTSFALGHKELTGVPEGTPVISTKQDFEQSLGELIAAVPRA